ncbi:MAG: energy transducer TonB [Desulfobulbaceae bacterium]|nr:energy transducer TonB [Desulfobulbaceae bacterium]
MKSLLLAGTLSLTLHGALMLVKFDSQGELPPQPLPQVISIDLQAPPLEAAPQRQQATAISKPPARIIQKAKPKAKPTVRPSSPPKDVPPQKAEEEQPAVAAETMATGQVQTAGQPEPGRPPSGEEAQSAATCLAALPAAGPPGGAGQPEIAAAPLYRQNPPPGYPALARRRGLEGVVQLDVLVNRRGGVNQVRLAATSGHELLDRAAVAAVENWLFTPGRRGEQTIDMWVRVPIRFALQE